MIGNGTVDDLFLIGHLLGLGQLGREVEGYSPLLSLVNKPMANGQF